ncbi:MAG: hypothetical protein ABIO40_09235 [Devosia sp.]
MRRDPLSRLHTLLESGELRLVHVIGVARSNSTLVCRLLGQQLDGAVYEPAVPSSIDPATNFARVILRAYSRARRTRPVPIVLAVKDISLFLTETQMALIARHAAHVVFTIRDPASAHASLVRQLQHEFNFWQRVDATVRQPFESLWMFISFLHSLPKFANFARTALPGIKMGLYRAGMAGWSLISWDRLMAQFAAIDPTRITVLDAAEMRRQPEAAAAELGRIARRLMPAGRQPMIELAAHTRMAPRSKWAAEARASAFIKPAASAVAPASEPLIRAIAARADPAYRALLDSAANPLRITPVRAAAAAA